MARPPHSANGHPSPCRPGCAATCWPTTRPSCWLHRWPSLPALAVEQGARRLTFRLHQQAGDSAGGGDWLIVMREVSDAKIIESMSLSFKLTAREAEVLYWVVKGKINRDIGDILGASPATVKNTWSACSPSWGWRRALRRRRWR